MSDPTPLRRPPGESICSRREFVQNAGTTASAMLLGGAVANGVTALSLLADATISHPPLACPSPFLTPAKDFYDVSRGTPRPHSLTGAALAEARLTPDTWRLEISADPFVEPPNIKSPATLERPRILADGTAIDLPTLRELGRKHAVHFLKAIQCLNLSNPLGQGLWTGVPLRDVLLACGKMTNVRRIYYWGFHNNDPKQIFQSSLSYSQAMETPPGELPVFLAYQLNGEPLSLLRGGPVRMVVPWAHGFKSIKWLQHIRLTNDFRANDTYANANNDPESFLKTAAYMDTGPEAFKVGEPVQIAGQVICGLSGLKHVEYWVREVGPTPIPLADDSPELLRGPWAPCELYGPPDWEAVLPKAIKSKDILGFDSKTGRPASWPLRYSLGMFHVTLRDLKPGRYEVRARAVDLNGFAQPEPRPAQKSGKNAIQLRRFQVEGG